MQMKRGTAGERDRDESRYVCAERALSIFPSEIPAVERNGAVGSGRFDVHILKKDHWVFDTSRDVREDAERYARAMLSAPGIEAVKVMRVLGLSGGDQVEREVFSAQRPVVKAIVVNPIDEAPAPCTGLADLLKLDARLVMGRLGRNYAERMFVTPSEVLHIHAEARRFSDKDNMLGGTIGRVATLQAERYGGSVRDRREELHALADKMFERARKAAAIKDLPSPGEVGLSATIAAVSKLAQPVDWDWLTTVAICRDLVKTRSWLGKFDLVVDLIRDRERTPDATRPILDGLLAEVIAAPGSLQEILGEKPSLGDALNDLFALVEGRLNTGARGPADRAVVLNALMVDEPALEATRYVVLEMARRELRGGQPLYRLDPGMERAVFRALLVRIVTPNGVVGGAGTAEALVKRALRGVEEGGATGNRRAMSETFEALPDGRRRALFLAALSGSSMAETYREQLEILIESVASGPGALKRFLDEEASLRENLDRFAEIYSLVADGDAAEPFRARLLDGLDRITEEYIVAHKVIERIDNPRDPLRDRADRLVGLCAKGGLRGQRSTAAVRKRVIEHLRRPNFETLYIEGLDDPDKRTRALARFYHLLGEAGFR